MKWLLPMSAAYGTSQLMQQLYGTNGSGHVKGCVRTVYCNKPE
jgi:hypothetical protein